MENKRMTRQELINELEMSRHIIQNKDFVGEDLSGMVFDNVEFSNCQFIRCCLDDVDFVHSLLNNVSFSFCLLEEANFSLCHIRNFFVNRCDFTNVSFVKANISHGGFYHTQLFNCDMTESVQYDVSFTNVDIENINYELSHLYNHYYKRCEISRVDYSQSSITCHIVMDDCRFDEVNTRGIDEIICYGCPIDENDDEVTLVEEI